MSDYQSGVTKKSEDDFAYILYGVTAAELALLLDWVCRPENRKNRSEGKTYVNTKYVAEFLGTVITVLVRSSCFEDSYQRHTTQMARVRGLPPPQIEINPIREYQITTDEWDLNCEIHHGSVFGTFPARVARGYGVIGGKKSTLMKPWFDGDVDTYLEQMTILRLMIPSLTEEPA